MSLLDIVNNVIQITLINFLTYMVYIKLINYKENNFKKMIIIFISSILEGIVGTIASIYIGILPAMILVYFIHSAIIAKVTNNKFQYSVIVNCISLVITYLVYVISILISAFILKVIEPSMQKDNIGILYSAIIMENLILYKLSRVRRFKNGLSFLQNKEKINNIGIVGVILCGIIIVIYSLFADFRGRKFNTVLTISIIVGSICLFIWIRKKITKYYKQRLKERTIEDLENEIKEKDIEISKILEENEAIAKINHKYSSRIRALEKVSTKIMTKPEIIEKMKAEFGEEFGDIQNQIKKLSEEYSKEIEEKVKHKNNIAKTGIFGIDNILEYMNSEANKENIKFDLKLNGNINYMVENVIDQSSLETLLGDHIKDAIIAIKSSSNTYKSILLILGIIDDCYEICIYDTGIEFEIETLLKLGKEATTTHKETGGSGIGFMTTFETLNKTKASLIIEEKHPMTTNDYTKAVRIRFDGKQQYKIRSYREVDIKEKQKDNKIIIEKIN